MYVIFPLDELLDLNSARENKRGRVTLDQQSHTRHTVEEVLPLSQPNQQLPNQLKPPLNNQPKTNLQQPTQPPTKQQKAPPTPPQKPPTPTQKPSLTKAPSKTSISVTPPSIVVPTQSPPSPPVSVNVKKPSSQQTVTTTTTTNTTNTTTTTATQPPSEQVTKRQRSSHSTSTETSSTSSTGAKGKALLSPQASGGPVANRSSWGGSPVVGSFQQSCPDRSGSFKAFKDLTVSTDGSSLKIIEPVRSESALDIVGSSQKTHPPLRKNNSFRSHLSDSCATRPRQTGVEPIRKASIAPATPKQPSPSESPKKLENLTEQPPLAPQGPKTTDNSLTKPGEPVQLLKEKQTAGNEAVKVKQEVPVQSAPPPAFSPNQQLTAAESLRIQQECLPPASPESNKANPTHQRHPSGRSNRSGSQKLSDLPPSGIGGASRGVTTAGSSTNPKTQGVLGSPRGLQQQQQQRNSVMASNEPSFRDLTNPSHNESLKAQNAFTFKLVKTGSTSGTLDEGYSPDENLYHVEMADRAGASGS